MRLAQAVRVGAWLLIGLNLLMALGSIGILMRVMTPEIVGIIERNEGFHHDSEEMLAVLALAGDGMAADARQQAGFMAALKRVEENATGKEELTALQAIVASAPAVFTGDYPARLQMVTAIARLGEIKRQEMVQEVERARQFGEAGAWGVVFMAISVFSIGLLFVRSLLRRVVKPMVELHTVITAYRNGETMRRCSGADMPQDVRAVFYGINELLDQGQARSLSQKDFSENQGQDFGNK